ncbi:HlyD family type I secretion periplasmic adaptor subunit [Agitococcus lubricus]|uniref:Membrane fusion protein (MFP) family protein n=1 Tax=Agitococcus lubricus TaxID=1077255 RepID=A0A2T5ISB7_9GAMM|nr:HlyD family type I secretion periplasmic adaptor subunit [Agitococcus lubricus]PTQ86709.1 hemolysin D [Agitococcus lubricus]
MSIKTHLQAWADLWGRYKQIFSHAWQHRHENDSKHLLPHEAQFLPAALALQESPVSPAPRVAMWLLIAFSAIAILWACFGKIDIVATAQGKTVPNEGSKVIQPFEISTIKAIHVIDGQQVKAGDVLIELDGTTAQADQDRISNDLAVSKLQVARAQAMLAALEQKKSPILQRPESVTELQFVEAQQLLAGQYAEYKGRLALLDADITRKEAEQRSLQEVIKKLERSLPISQQRADNFKRLAEDDNVPKDAYLQREQQRIDQEGELATSRSRLKENSAALAAVQEQKRALSAEIARIHLDSLNEGTQRVSALSQELIKAQSRNELTRLVAPVDGTVQQLAVRTVGGVVTEAQPLMVIVPKDNTLEVEAFVENQDIGFVNAGQEAEIKIQTFPYTKYGVIHGVLTSVSNDAINDEKRGLIYAAKLKMAHNTMMVEGKQVNLSAGMAVTVEIKTGTRRVIEYFLKPLLQYKNESLRER